LNLESIYTKLLNSEPNDGYPMNVNLKSEFMAANIVNTIQFILTLFQITNSNTHFPELTKPNVTQFIQQMTQNLQGIIPIVTIFQQYLSLSNTLSRPQKLNFTYFVGISAH
jgi:hypothetical protein